MKKLQLLFFPTILALAFGLMLSCAKEDDSSSSETDTSSSSTVTVSGKVQKGPYVQGTEITVRELDSSMTPTGNTFTGTIDDNTGSFSIKGTLTNKIVELSALGYYFNEVSGSLSNATLTLSALSDLTDSNSVNVNLMTHLEKKRVEYLMDNSKMTFAAAKTQAQTEIMKIFNIDNVTLGNSETLDISKSGDGNAVLLAISVILQSDKTEAELTELLSTINTDIRTDGTLDGTSTVETLTSAGLYLRRTGKWDEVKTNITSRYSSFGITADIDDLTPFFSSMPGGTGWPGSYQLGTSSNDEANGVATDSSGNVYVTGGTGGALDGTNAGNKDLFVVKYNSSGTKQWTKQLGTSSNDNASGVATDSSGNVYVTGITSGGLDGNTNAGSSDIFLVKYNSSGTKQWTKQLGTSSSDFARGVATDSSGNVYVTGITIGGLDGTNAGNWDLFVVKYNSSGTKQWTKQLGTSSSDFARGVATDSSGNVYVTGYTKGGLDGNTNSGQEDLFVVKYYDNGTKDWTRQLGTSNGDYASGVATDSSGNVYVTGGTGSGGCCVGLDGTNAGGNDLFLVKYNSSGTKQWTKQLGTSSNDEAYGVATDSSGNVYVTGYTNGGLDGNTSAGAEDLFLVKYNSSGTKQWTKQLGSSSSDIARGVATDSSGNVYVTGITSGGLDGNTNAGSSDIFLVKYNSSGTKQ